MGAQELISPNRLRQLALLAVLLLAACLGGDTERSEGAFCHGSVECAGELECRYDRCRRPCLFDADCGPESACIASLSMSGYDFADRGCTLPSEEECPSLVCPTALYCSGEGLCREPCDDHDQCGPDRHCSAGVCLEGPGG